MANWKPKNPATDWVTQQIFLPIIKNSQLQFQVALEYFYILRKQVATDNSP